MMFVLISHIIRHLSYVSQHIMTAVKCVLSAGEDSILLYLEFKNTELLRISTKGYIYILQTVIISPSCELFPLLKLLRPLLQRYILLVFYLEIYFEN